MIDFPEKVYVNKRQFAYRFKTSEYQQEYIRADLVPTWQPIETAPRDGTDILCMNKEGYVRQVFWSYDSWRYGDDYEFNTIKWMLIPK